MSWPVVAWCVGIFALWMLFVGLMGYIAAKFIEGACDDLED